MIRMTDIKKSYDKANLVLRGVSLEVADGELLSIIGASGSGKSTLLNVIGGLDRTYAGTAEVLGKDLRKLNDRQISEYRNQSVGFIFQSFNLLNHLTCGQNVALPAYFNKKLTEKDIDTRIDKSLDRVGLLHKRGQFPLHLSGGERQRIAIARALFNEPAIILCDEPTGALDSKTGEQILSLFETLNRDTGVTMIIVTHSKSVSRRADRVIEIVDGLISSDAPSQAGEA